jgi:hypothetical protein
MWHDFRMNVRDHCQHFGNCLGLAIPMRRMDHCVAWLPRIIKANVTAREMLDSALRQNFDEISPGI